MAQPWFGVNAHASPNTPLPPIPTKTPPAQPRRKRSAAPGLLNLAASELLKPRMDSICAEPQSPGSTSCPPSPMCPGKPEEASTATTPSALKEFVSGYHDYSIDHDRPLGKGQWSTVWGAEAMTSLYAPKPQNDLWKLRRQTYGPLSLITPPTTPVRASFGSGFTNSAYDLAIKMPSGRSASNVIMSEARLLSFLSEKQEVQDYIVPFHGLDRRNGSLVMQALPLPLADGAFTYRNQHPSASLTAFPQIALHLLEGLCRLHENNVVHADIKPANVLMDFSTDEALPLYADFSAAFFASTGPTSTLAAGTWEFLAPELCVSSTDKPPSSNFASDVYALAVTLLHFILDASPFAHAPNTFLMRDMVKKGRPLDYALELPHSKRTLDSLRADLLPAFDLFEFLRMGLKKDPAERPNARQWLSWLSARVQMPADG